MSNLCQTIHFLDSSLPPIQAGKYTLEVTQTITQQDKPDPLGVYSAKKRTVHVQGNRFSIDPLDIDSVFPPEGGAGDYGNVLPHVTFTQKTQPWEQKLGAPSARAPWLAVLVFHESDEGGIPTITPAMAGDLLRKDFCPSESKPGTERPSSLPVMEHDKTIVIATYADAVSPGQWMRPNENTWDPCLVIDVPVKLFRDIAPTQADLPWLAHSRTDSGAAGEREFSAVLANRLPLPDGVSMACLVSLEGMESFLPPASNITTRNLTATHIRLVVMKAWTFRSGVDLLGFYRDVSCGPLKLPYQKPALETPEDQKVKNALAMGYTALDHNTRWGDRAISWYRGPFLPFSAEVTRSIPMPPIDEKGYMTGHTPLSSADEALRYDPEMGMLDASYAAAWQLGRLMALRDGTFSYDLYQWKREIKQKIIQPIAVDVAVIVTDLMKSLSSRMNPTESARTLMNDIDKLKKHLEDARAPQSVVTRIDMLRRLEGVPMDYLVPDERMLPPESLRFFQVDQNWIYSLIEGAYSIGRVSTSDQQQDAATCPHCTYKQTSGFLLRSAIVSGWPTLQVRVEVSSASEAKELRCQRITPDILLYLVEVEGPGVITSVTLQVPPESVEFHLPARKTVPFRPGNQLVVDIHALAQKERTPAHFALKLAAVVKPLLTWDARHDIVTLKFDPMDETDRYEWQFLVTGKPFGPSTTIRVSANQTALVELQIPLHDDLPAGEIAVRVRAVGTASRVRTGRWITSTTLHRPSAYDVQPVLRYIAGEDKITAEWPSSGNSIPVPPRRRRPAHEAVLDSSGDSLLLEAQIFSTLPGPPFRTVAESSSPYGALVKCQSQLATEPIRAVLPFDDKLQIGRVNVRFRNVTHVDEETLPGAWTLSTQSLVRFLAPISGHGQGNDSYNNGVLESLFFDQNYNMSFCRENTLEMWVCADHIFKVRARGPRAVFPVKYGDVPPGTYTVKARVLGQDDRIIDSIFQADWTPVRIYGRPTVRVGPGELLEWNGIDGVSRYRVVFKGSEERDTYVNDSTTDVRLDVHALGLQSGHYQVIVTPVIPVPGRADTMGPASEAVTIVISSRPRA